MGNYKKLGKNITLVAIGTFSSKLLNFFLIPLYTACLTTSEYGTVDVMFVTINLLLPLVTIVIFEALLRFALDHQYDKSTVFMSGIFVSGIGVIVFLLFSPLILLFDSFKDYYFLFVICFIARVVYEDLIYFARGIEEIKAYSLTSIFNTALVLGLNIAFLVLFHLGIVGYMLANALAYTLSAVFLFALSKMRRYFPKNLKFDFRVIKEMATYSLPMVPNSISWWISNSSDKYVLTYFYGTTITGLYSIAYKIPSIINAFSSMFEKAWQISSVEDFGSDASKTFYSDVYYKYASLQLLCSSGVILFANLIARIMFKLEFYNAVMFVPILVIAVMFHSLGAFFGTIYTAAKHTSTLFYSTSLGAVFNIIANFVLIPKYNGYGAAIATLCSYLIVYLFRLVDSRKYLKFEVQYISDIISYLLIAFQALIHFFSFKYGFVFSLCAFLFLIILRRKFVFDCFSMLKEIVKRRFCK